MAKIIVNGVERTLVIGTNLAELLAEMNYFGKRVAVERNGELVKFEELGSIRLEDGDILEIVGFVGGG